VLKTDAFGAGDSFTTKVRRLPVVNRDKRLVGIIAIADVAANEAPEIVGAAVSGISEPVSDR
jgi:CBS domain-containing protein